MNAGTRVMVQGEGTGTVIGESESGIREQVNGKWQPAVLYVVRIDSDGVEIDCPLASLTAIDE